MPLTIPLLTLSLGNAALWLAAVMHYRRQASTLRHQLARALYADPPATLVLPEDHIRAAFREIRGGELPPGEMLGVNQMIRLVRQAGAQQTSKEGV